MSCGCPEDYHLADCPLMNPPQDEPPDPDDFDDWRYPDEQEDEDWTSLILGG